MPYEYRYELRPTHVYYSGGYRGLELRHGYGYDYVPERSNYTVNQQEIEAMNKACSELCTWLGSALSWFCKLICCEKQD